MTFIKIIKYLNIIKQNVVLWVSPIRLHQGSRCLDCFHNSHKEAQELDYTYSADTFLNHRIVDPSLEFGINFCCGDEGTIVLFAQNVNHSVDVDEVVLAGCDALNEIDNVRGFDRIEFKSSAEGRGNYLRGNLLAIGLYDVIKNIEVGRHCCRKFLCFGCSEVRCEHLGRMVSLHDFLAGAVIEFCQVQNLRKLGTRDFNYQCLFNKLYIHVCFSLLYVRADYLETL